MKKLTLILLFTTNLCVACNLHSKQDVKNNQMKTTINKKDLNTLLAGYTTRPVYYASYGNAGCLFDIRINDVSVDKLTEKGTIGGTLTTINTELYNGTNKVSVRLYPNPEEEMIVSQEPFHLKIGYKDFSMPEGKRPWEWAIEMPEIMMPEGGLPYYEWEGEFEAKIPYKTTGWSDCIDLRDIPDIEERVIAEFKRIKELYVKQDTASIRQLLEYKYYDIAVPLYKSSEVLRREEDDDVKDILEHDPKGWQEIEDFELVYYADGRLVTLESKKDGGFPSAILSIEETEYSFEYFYIYMCLGIRQGTNELIPIR